MIFPKATSINLTIDDTSKQQSITAGDMMIIPANIGQSASWTTELEMIALELSPNLVAQTIDDATNFAFADLVPHFATPDPLVHQLGLSLKAVLAQNPTGSCLYAQTTVALLAVHLLQHYGQRKLEFKD